MTEQVEKQATRSNTTLWLLIATFAVPIIGAYAYFFFVDDYALGNHGELIDPVIQIESLALSDADGNRLQRDALIHGWKMLYVADARCDSVCQESIYNMRQINTALGKNAGRFKHMIIHTAPMADDFRRLIDAEHSEALHSYASAEPLSRVLSVSPGQLMSNSIYIMDPLGNIMMRFDPGTSPKLILKDLNRLLKISRIG